MSFRSIGEFSSSLFLTSNFMAGSINFSKSLPSKLFNCAYFSTKLFLANVISLVDSCNARARRELT